jgi:acrylyl-CoA reductase (NADPH)
MSFNAILLKEKDGKVTAGVTELQEDELPEGDVTVDVAYSDLNYKDGLILNGMARLVRDYPHIPGIDLVGRVTDSASSAFRAGDSVILTGWGLGERHWGGYAQKARVKSEWLVKLPDGMSMQQAMALGTAGFTAMLAVMALEQKGISKEGDVLVTGASGGVGSVAVTLLAALGYTVTAATGSEASHDYLRDLGAAAILDRAEIASPSKPLDKGRWAGCVDTVGGDTLATVFTQMAPHASISVCGNAGGNELKTTVLPLILRGVSLLGIDSVMCPQEQRQTAWRRLAEQLPMDKLDAMTTVVPLSEAIDLGKKILKGQVQGRTVIDVNA